MPGMHGGAAGDESLCRSLRAVRPEGVLLSWFRTAQCTFDPGDISMQWWHRASRGYTSCGAQVACLYVRCKAATHAWPPGNSLETCDGPLHICRVNVLQANCSEHGQACCAHIGAHIATTRLIDGDSLIGPRATLDKAVLNAAATAVNIRGADNVFTVP